MKTYVKALGLVGALALMGALTACKEEPPSPAKVHLMAGDKHRVAQEWKEAADEYGKSLDADPKQEKLWETKAYCHQQAGDTDGAVATIMKFAETKTDAAEKAKLIRFCADLWKQKPDLAKAESTYLEAIKVLPTDDESYTWLAEIHATKGGARDQKATPVAEELAKALEYYNKVAEIKPDNPNTYVNQRVILYKYLEIYKKQKADAEAEVQEQEKSKEKDAKDKVAAAKEKVDKAQATIDETNKKIEVISAKYDEAKKKAAAAASAAAAAAAAAPASSATKK